MLRIFSLSLIISFFLVSNSLASFSLYTDPYSRDSVIAPIQIKDKGVYNLVISIHFLNEPYDKKPYVSDEYENLISRLNVEWSGVALLQVLKTNELSINELASLKVNIETEIAQLIERLKPNYSLKKDVEVIFSLSNFFLIEPKKL